MISLSEYINEQLITDTNSSNEKPVNEMLLTCLVWGAAIGLGLKVLRGLKNGVSACWDTILGDELKRWESLDDDKNIINEARKKISSKDLFALQIPDDNILRKVIEKTKPKEGRSTKTGHGLWTLAKKLDEEKELWKVNKGKIAPQYAAIIKKESNDIVGIFGFSAAYWHNKKKSNNQKDKEFAKEYEKYIHIIDIDICPEYDIDSIDDFVWKTIFDVQKELKTKGITIWSDDTDEQKEYKLKGFENVQGHNNLMFCNNKDYKEEK